MSSLIDAAIGILRELAIDPLTLDIDADAVRIVAMMTQNALQRRSRGPYTPDDLPPEAMKTVDWVLLRMFSSPERPEFTVEGGGPWPALLVELPRRRVVVRYVVPEAAPPVYVRGPGDLQLGGKIHQALETLATSLRAVGERLGGEPPVTVSLSYPDDPDYEANVARMPEQFRHGVPPVIPTFDIGRSGCSAKQRAAQDEVLRASTFEGGFEKLGRTGFTMNLGEVIIRDSGG